MQLTHCQITFDLKAKKVPSVLLLYEGGIWCVKLDAELEQGLVGGKAHLMVELFLNIQPVLKEKKKNIRLFAHSQTNFLLTTAVVQCMTMGLSIL